MKLGSRAENIYSNPASDVVVATSSVAVVPCVVDAGAKDVSAVVVFEGLVRALNT